MRLSVAHSTASCFWRREKSRSLRILRPFAVKCFLGEATRSRNHHGTSDPPAAL
jgi:hypothetical protein